MKRIVLFCAYVVVALVGSGTDQATAGIFDWLEELADPGIKSVSPGDLELFRNRANDGDPEAHLALGTVYEKGLGVPQSWARAHRHFNLASALSPVGPSGESARAAAKRRMARVEERMTPAQVGEAQSDAESWMASFERRRQAEALARAGMQAFDQKAAQARAALDGFWKGLKAGE
ncbi:MAG: SEL1-like repeat protein [Phaeospirillum sp.]|nr:SEL1-like repeat protein [Phaeospirillum sp.]